MLWHKLCVYVTWDANTVISNPVLNKQVKMSWNYLTSKSVILLTWVWWKWHQKPVSDATRVPCAVCTVGATVKNSQLSDFDQKWFWPLYLLEKSRRVHNNRLVTLCNILEAFIYNFVLLKLQIYKLNLPKYHVNVYILKKQFWLVNLTELNQANFLIHALPFLSWLQEWFLHSL